MAMNKVAINSFRNKLEERRKERESIMKELKTLDQNQTDSNTNNGNGKMSSNKANKLTKTPEKESNPKSTHSLYFKIVFVC